MRILLTGGTGFIGQQVLRQLLAGGHEVTCLRRPRQPGNADNPASSCHWHDCTLDDRGGLEAVFKAACPEVVIHLAWYAEPGKYLESPVNLDLVNQTVGLCQLAVAAGCRRFVAAGSCTEYDVSPGLLAESGPTEPATLYGATKLSTSHLCRVIASRAGMAFSWGRIFYVYGPGEDARRFVPLTITKMLKGEPFQITSGRMVRDFLSVHDVAAGFVRLAEADSDGVYNVCSGQPITIRGLAELIAARCGTAELLSFGGQPRSSFDPPIVLGTNARLRGLGWQPAIELNEGIDDVISWWRQTTEPGMPVKSA